MSSKSRLALFLTIIIIFVATAPLLLLYALGYRFDRITAALRPTGTIAIRFVPATVQVSVDGVEKPEKKRFVKLDGLTPGNHTVKLEKDGYQTWEKTLPTTVSEITWQEHVILFYTDPQLSQLSTQPASLLAADSTGEQIAWWEPTGAAITSLYMAPTNTKTTPRAIFSGAIQIATTDQLTWSPDARYIYFSGTPIGDTTTRHYVIDLGQASLPVTQLESKHPELSYTTAQWDRSNPERLLLLQQQHIFALNARTFTLQPLVAEEPVYGIASSSRGIAYITSKTLTDASQTPQNVLKIIAGTNTVPETRIDPLPSVCDHYAIAWSRFDELAILDQCAGAVAVGTTTLTPVMQNISNIAWAARATRDHEVLLANSANELWSWDSENRQAELLTRTSKPIVTAQLNATGTHVYYISDQTFMVSETQVTPGGALQFPLLSWTYEAPSFIPIIAQGITPSEIYVLAPTPKSHTATTAGNETPAPLPAAGVFRVQLYEE